MINEFIKKLNDLSIRHKLFILFIALISVPFSVFTLINAYVTSADAEKQALESSQKVLLQAKSVLEYKTSYVKNVMDLLVVNDTVQDLINKDSSYYRDNIGNWFIDSQKFTELIYSVQSNPDIVKLNLYMKDGFAGILNTEEFHSLSKVEDTQWYKKLTSKSATFDWIPQAASEVSQDERYVSFIRKIPYKQDINQLNALIGADIPEKVLKKILDQAVITKSSSIVLINSNNTIISSSGNPELISDIDSIADVLNKYDQGSEGSEFWKRIKLKDNNILLGNQSIENSDWRLILLVPYKDILALSVKTRNQMILILALVAPLMFPVSFMVAASATKRIRRLISHMRKVERGNFDVDILPGSNDEIGEMTKSFNAMLTKMAILIDDKFKLGREIKNMELKALQAQINPHFLYNTLDLINWMSIKAKAPEIGNVVAALSKFYKLSLSKGEDIVTIQSELEHIKAYVQIQNLRFGDSISLEIDVPEELYDYRILKIVLQPIVENSILHGILEKDEEVGAIKISAHRMEDTIILEVADDGVGINEEVAREILTGASTSEAHGYGVRNINERLKLYYSSEFGLSYHSIPGAGTTVSVRIPAVL